MKNFANIIKKVTFILWISGKDLYSKNFTNQASALSFVTVLSLVPIISIFVYILNFFPFFLNMVNDLNQYLYMNLAPDSNQAVKKYLAEFIQQAGHIPILSLLLFGINGWLMIAMIEDTFNTILNSHYKKTHYFRTFVTGIFFLLLPILISIMTIVSAFISSITWLSNYTHFISSTLNIIINIVAITFLYVIAPNIHVTWREGLYGGVVAAILCEVARKIFSVYIHNFSNYAVVYGTLATIPIFLLWVYFAWCIIIFGALIIQNIKSDRLHTDH